MLLQYVCQVIFLVKFICVSLDETYTFCLRRLLYNHNLSWKSSSGKVDDNYIKNLGLAEEVEGSHVCEIYVDYGATQNKQL